MFTFSKRAVVVALALLVGVLPARAAEGDEHLVTGNPRGATADKCFVVPLLPFAVRSCRRGPPPPGWCPAPARSPG
jgi:hypothetical protein